MSSQGLVLQLLGGVQLVRIGVPVTGRAVQRRRLALLAFLARSPERRAHRDRLMGLLWAEHAPEAARRLLNESIYVIRRELGAELLRTEGETIRLDAQVACDADLFEEAVRAGAFERAVSCYGGALFGAWSVGDAPEFEQWAESERGAFTRRFAECVPKAAELAGGRGDFEAAAAMFARLGEEDPDSAVAAEGEASALAMSGEPLRACRRLDQFAERWQQEFGGAPPKKIGALREAIVSGAIGRTSGPVSLPMPAPVVVASPASAATAAATAAPSTRRLGWRWALLPVAALGVVAAFLKPQRARAPVDEGLVRVAIVSRSLATRDSALTFLREAITEGVTNQLSANRFLMASSAETRAVEAGRISLDSLVAMKQLSTLVEFAFESRPSRLRVTARLLNASSREVLSSSIYEKPLDDALSLESELVRFVVDALRQRLRQSVSVRDTAEGQRDATARKLLITAVREREDASEVLRNGNALDLEAARSMLLGADSLLRRALVIEPEWDAVQLERARVMRDRVKAEPEATHRSTLDSAIAITNALVSRDSQNAAALSLRGALHLRQALALAGGAGDTIALRAADADLRRAVQLEPQRAEAWLSLSTVQTMRGQSATSLISAQRAIEHDAFLVNGQQAYFHLFAGAITTRKVDEALQWCRRGRLAYPGEDAFYVCELTLMRERPAQPLDVETARRLVAQVDSLSRFVQPKTTVSYMPAYSEAILAGVSARAGNAVGARDALRRARALVGNNVSLQLDLMFDEAWVQLMLGNRGRAVSLLKQVIAARPPMARILTSAPLYRDIAGEVLAGATAAVRPTNSAVPNLRQ